MALRLQFARFCGALAVLAAFCFAPSAVQAHAGHGHHAQPAAASAPQPAAVATAPAAGQTDVTVAKRSHVQAELKAGDVGLGPSSGSSGCASGCCAGMPCTVCVGLLAPPEVFAPAVASPGALLDLPDASPRHGLGPDGIRRPPRSFI
jgi:hypothetical protein